jgi:Tol biopolymer transport system component
MTPERWGEIDRVWHAVLTRPGAERAAAIAELCAGDRELRQEVEALLTSLANANAAGFGNAPGLATRSGSLVGSRLGPYTVDALLGTGGMGEVYQAHDSTLGRDVALKILPDLWHGDPDRRARFDREARLLASLNHPNIGAIYGVHESDASAGLSVKALVLELVEGVTLADHLTLHATAARRGLPIDEVTSVAAQIIDALEAAHERGIVHRDLKPANIKITPEGRVKVLDFGLARAVTGGGSSPALAHSPTLTGVTHGGVLLGTAAYMSPEQARGRKADKRTDIWAFGCVLYEMMTGTPAFGGDGVSDVIANVIKADPDWRALPADTPPALRLCLQQCLQKDLRQRFHDIADVRLVMEGAFAQPVEGPRAAALTSPLAYAMWAAAVLVAAAAAAGVFFKAPNQADLAETRFEIATPPTYNVGSLAISPDGRSVVFAGNLGQPLLLRRLESQDVRPIIGTENGAMPFWSPDSQSIGFFVQGVLKRIDLAGGFIRTLASAPQPRGGTWNREGTIVFAAGSVGPLSRVTAEGGNVQEATDLLSGQTNHRFPEFLPDGRRFLMISLGSADVRGVYQGTLADRIVRRVSDRESAYGFMPPNQLLFARQGGLWARRLNADYTSTEGDLVPVAPKVALGQGATGFGAFSASATGSIAFRSGIGVKQLVWLDRNGRTVATVGSADDTSVTIGALSSDGRTAAVSRNVEGNGDIWLVDVDRGVSRRLTSEPSGNAFPIFSPDGSRVLYVDDGKKDVNLIYERRADGTGGANLIFESDENTNPNDWSPDGRYILYDSHSSQTNVDLMALPLFGDRKPLVIAKTPFAETCGRFSPDGHWVAYCSDESGSYEVYVQPFPGLGPKVPVSIGGGRWPRWRRDGRELFYVANDNRLMAVPLVWKGERFEAGPPRPLFPIRVETTGGYEPSADGQRFLVTTVVSEASPITVILNWKPPAH